MSLTVRDCLLSCVLVGLGLPAASAASRLQTDIDVPRTVRALNARKTAQVNAAKSSGVFQGFQFSNEIAKSGITFQPGLVDDCTRLQKPTVYDHGTGLAAADVDNDGNMDLYFVNQLGGSELWRNRGDATFENITDRAGVGLKDKVSVSAAFGDADNDGDADLFVTTVRMGNVLFENLGGGKFRDVSKAAGVDYVGHSSAAIFVDYDNDGLLDLFVANVGVYTTDEKGRGGYYAAVQNIAMGFLDPKQTGRSVLYKNLGGLKFKDVSKEVNLEHLGWSPDATICDFNEDGFADLYVLNMSGANFFYENQGGKSFVEKTKEYFARTSNGSMGVKNFDFDQDGKLDLYITDMHSDMSPAQLKASNRNFRLDFEKAKSEGFCGVDWTPQERRDLTNNFIFGNALYLKTGSRAYNEVSDKANAETFWPWGPSVGDFNADGFDDAFITSGMGFPLRYSINSVLLNDNGRRFIDAEFVTGVEPRPSVEQPFFTLDCSGEDKEHALCYHKSGILTVKGARSSRSSVAADFDGDGDLDVITGEFNDLPLVLINNLTSKRSIQYLKVKLTGTASNCDGYGATVRVRAGGKTFTQYNDGKSGYLAQSTMPLYFGLGDATKVDAVEVTWPSGKKNTVTENLGMNRQIVVTEPRN